MPPSPRLPLPDVPRLVRRARNGGPYTGSGADATRSPIERFTTLYRALEHIGRFNQTPVEEALAQGLEHLRAPGARSAVRDMAYCAARLTPAVLGGMVDEHLLGAHRDAVIASVQSAARRLAAGAFDPSDRRARRDATLLLRGLRNAAVHAKMMTTDRDVGATFAVACVVLDELVVTTYARAFQLTPAELAQALSGAEEAV